MSAAAGATASSPSTSGRRACAPSLVGPDGTIHGVGPRPDRARTSRRSRAGRNRTRRSTGRRSARPVGGCWPRPASRPDALAGGDPDDPARHGRRDRRRRRRRCARRSSGSTTGGPTGLPPFGGVGGVTAARVPGARPARHDRGLRRRLRGATGCAPTSRRRGARSGTTCCCRGFLTHRLTGRFVDSAAAQVGYLPFDYRRFRWAAPGRLALDRRAGRPGLAARARAADRAARRADARPPPRRPGLPAGLPVIAAAADKACEVLGSGAITPEVAAISYGTAATVNTTMRRYVEAIPLIPPFPSAVPGAWSLEIQVYRGYWMVEWFKREFAAAEVARAAAAGRRRRRCCSTSSSRSVPPGSMGLTLQPYWSPACASPVRRPRARSSGSATCTPGRTSTGRSSRAWPTRCATAWSGRPGGRR